MPFVKGDPRINRTGRKKGARGKKNIPTDKEVQDEIQRYGIKAIKKLIEQIESEETSQAIVQKNSQWLAEMFFNIEDMKAAATQTRKDAAQKAKEQPKTEDKPEAPKPAILSLTAVK